MFGQVRARLARCVATAATASHMILRKSGGHLRIAISSSSAASVSSAFAVILSARSIDFSMWVLMPHLHSSRVNRELPDQQIGWDRFLAGHLLHEERNALVEAFVAQTPRPGRIHLAAPRPALATTNDPIRLLATAGSRQRT